MGKELKSSSHLQKLMVRGTPLGRGAPGVSRQDCSEVHTGADFSEDPTRMFCFSLAREVALTGT